MNTAKEIVELKQNNLDTFCEAIHGIEIEDAIDACHEFANQFKQWIKLDGTNNPNYNTTVVAYDEEKGQCMGLCSSGGFWYEEKGCTALNKVTHYHYQLANPA